MPNISSVGNAIKNRISVQFHMVDEYDFQTVSLSGSKVLPSNWCEKIKTDYCRDEPSFKTPLEAKIDDKHTKSNSHF